MEILGSRNIVGQGTSFAESKQARLMEDAYFSSGAEELKSRRKPQSYKLAPFPKPDAPDGIIRERRQAAYTFFHTFGLRFLICTKIILIGLDSSTSISQHLDMKPHFYMPHFILLVALVALGGCWPMFEAEHKLDLKIARDSQPMGSSTTHNSTLTIQTMKLSKGGQFHSSGCFSRSSGWNILATDEVYHNIVKRNRLSFELSGGQYCRNPVADLAKKIFYYPPGRTR